MSERWKDILKAAIPIGQMQQDTAQNLGQIVDKLIEESKYTDRLNNALGKLVGQNPDQGTYRVKSPLINRIYQKFKFRGQPDKIISMLEQRLAQEYQAESVKLGEGWIEFNNIKAVPQEGE